MNIASYRKTNSEAKLSWLLEASGLSKNGWYHSHKEMIEPTEVKSKIEAILIESPYYGYKRVAKQLKRNGEIINHKKVYRIMGEYYLLQVRKSKKVPRTTNSNHN